MINIYVILILYLRFLVLIQCHFYRNIRNTEIQVGWLFLLKKIFVTREYYYYNIVLTIIV